MAITAQYENAVLRLLSRAIDASQYLSQRINHFKRVTSD